ncbi:MAG: tetratricopeptide repeat protein [Desulfovibrio sp.]|nr:tetratricopeptide repeat protein [Desulfovibrio sp.]
MANAPQALSKRQKRALRVLGFLFLRMGQYVRARRLFAALAALDHGDLHARCALAYACIQLGDGEAALHTLTGLAPGDPVPGGDAMLHLLLARVHTLIGDAQAARESIAAFWKDHKSGGLTS